MCVYSYLGLSLSFSRLSLFDLCVDGCKVEPKKTERGEKFRVHCVAISWERVVGRVKVWGEGSVVYHCKAMLGDDNGVDWKSKLTAKLF